MSMDNEFDVVVVGAGIAGLTAAATATRGGARTLVLEAHRPGGRARTTEREGFVLNLGAHALYRKGAGGRVLADLGITPVGSAPPLGRYRGSLAGALHRLPTGPGSLLRSTLLGTRSKVQLGGLLARMPRMDPAALSGISVRAWLDDIGLRPDADAVVLALLRLSTYCPDVDRFGADAALTQLQIAAAGGVRYLDGGWSRLVDSLGVGTDLRATAAVRALEPAAGRFELRTEDGPVVARQVVVAVGLPAAARALLPEPPDWGDLGGPVTAACLDLGVRSVPSPGYVLGIDAPLYATTQGPPARQAPEGQAVVAVLRYGARSSELDRPELEDYRRRCGVADEDVVIERFLA
ncbi:MAG TPA: FAD-dependent oxidoreductase, partial [Acidimicrobiales bacterium]